MTQKHRILLVGIALSLATGAAAQRFIWPPTGQGADRARPEPSATPVIDQAVAEFPQSRVAAPTIRATTPAGPPIVWKILENPNGPNAAYFFDPVRQVFAVYHVDPASGQIMLKSVRSLAADLQLDQFNSSNPAPKDIQSMLDEAR